MKSVLESIESQELLKALIKRYGEGATKKKPLIFFRKKWFWLTGVCAAAWIKRGLDIILSALFLILFFPVFLLIALLIKMEDGGPVFYITSRVGKWGREFLFPKFRSMRVDADQMKKELLSQNESKGGVIFKMKKDPRITRVGRVLRKTSLDELPQLWCVLKGDMSLVGPRPHILQEVAMYTLKERRRLDVIPGLTCFWQVQGRSDIPFDQQVKLDTKYIESQSVWLDLKLIFQTFWTVLIGKGAY